MNLKKTILFVMLSVLVLSFASAEVVPATVNTVKMNGIALDTDYTNVLSIERGEQLDLIVVLSASEAIDNAEVEVTISGYEYGSISETTDMFDMENATSYMKEFSLALPENMDSDNYQLKVRLASRVHEDNTYYYSLKIDAARHQLKISDFSLSPSNEIEAGHSLIGRVRVKNTGLQEQDDVKVTMSIPGLGLRDTQYLADLISEDTDFFEDLMLFIPECTNEGTYDVRAEVEYDQTSKVVTAEETLFVKASDLCEDEDRANTVVTVLESSNVVRGALASYPLTMQNTGLNAETYTISLSDVSSFGNAVIEPSNVVVIEGGETKTVFIQLTASESAQVGEHVFTATITSANEASQVSLTADISEEQVSTSTFRKTLEVVLIVLVIVLIVLALIIGFRKTKKPEDEEQTYY